MVAKKEEEKVKKKVSKKTKEKKEVVETNDDEETVSKSSKEDSVPKEVEEPKMKLSDLPGVGPAAVEKLESAGIFDLMGVAVMGPKELSEMAGMGEAAYKIGRAHV